MSINAAKWTFAPDVLASSITSFLLLTFVRFHAEIFSNFSHSLSTAAFAAGIFMACGIGINSCTKLSPLPAVWFSWWFGKDSPFRSLVDSLSSKIHASFDLISLDLPPIHNFDCSCLSCKAKREPLVFPISCEHSWWSLWIPCPPGQWNKCALSSWSFRVTTYASPSAWHFFPISSRDLAMNYLAWMPAAFLSLSTDHKKSVWRFLFQTKFDVWGCSVHTHPSVAADYYQL